MQKKDILLLICPMWGISIPPLGISYLASYLEHKGISVDLLDINIETYRNSNKTRKKLWKMENYNVWAREDWFDNMKKVFRHDLEYYAQEILKKGYKIIGFSLYGANILFSIELAIKLKEKRPDLFVIFGGPSCSFLYNRPKMPIRMMYGIRRGRILVDPGIVDAFVVGEGEEVLFNLVNSHLSDELNPIPGAMLYLGERYSCFVPQSPIENLDYIPYPAWDKLSLHLYLQKGILPILLSRGCTNRCTFCNDWKIWSGKYRCRSALNIFKEINVMVKKYNIKIFQCNDLLFNGNLKMLEQLAEYLINADLNIHWSVQGAIKIDMSLSLLKKLKKSGLGMITYGIESLSENVLKKMSKNYTFEDIRKVLEDTKRAGIGTSINFIVGFPNETEEEFNITKRRLIEIKKYVDLISSLNPCLINADTDLEKFPQRFFISPLKGDFCSTWKSLDEKNTYDVRKKRAQELSEFAENLGIETLFTAIYNETDFFKENNQSYKKEKLKIFQIIRDFVKKSIQKRNIKRKKRGIFKWLVLIFVLYCTLFYIGSFWVYSITKKTVRKIFSLGRRAKFLFEL